MDVTTFKKDFQFSLDTTIPMYEQLTSFFRLQIQAETLSPGEKLITEKEISDALNISRTTVRQAMDQLVAEGLLIRHRGRGSFVASPKMKRPLNQLYNFTDNMNELGATPSSDVLKCCVEEVEPFIHQVLNLPPNQTLAFHLTRLRCANTEPILFEDTFIPYYLCEGIEQIDFRRYSLYQTLSNRFSLNLYHATETIEAINIGKSEAELLNCKSKSPGYKITRLSHLDNGVIFEYTTSITKADRCMFQLELYKNNSNTKNALDFQRHVSL